jgi:glycosyltransferase involved in cell wall biosynthesis
MNDETLQRRRPTTEPLVLHVIPTPQARGAQREARALADALDAPGLRVHRVLCLFDGAAEVRADLSLRIPSRGVAAAGFDPRVVLQLRSALTRLDPSLVVAHGGDPLKYLVPASIGRRRPLAYYAIGTYAGGRLGPAQVRLWRALAARADVVAAEGDEVREECVRLLGVPADRVTMTPNGRDPAVFSPRPAGPTSPVPMVTFVGALTDSKRPDRFVALVAALRARGLGFRAQLIGDGPMRSALEEPARAADVQLLGSRDDVPALLSTSDLMVFPSRSTGEGMPGVLIEAGLCGIPVVATAVPGVRTVIIDGTTGLVVPENRFEPLVEATARLIGDPLLRTTLGAAARARCLERFTLDAVARQWLGLLGPLLPAGPVAQD